MPDHSRDYVSHIRRLRLGPSDEGHWLLEPLLTGTIELPNLTDLTIGGLFSIPPVTWPDLPCLRRLRILHTTDVGHAGFPLMILIPLLDRTKSTLEELDLQRFAFDSCVPGQWPLLINLRRLILKHTIMFRGPSMSDLLRCLPVLNELHLHEIDITDVEWPTFSPELHTLILEGSFNRDRQPTAEGYDILPTALTRLEIHSTASISLDQLMRSLTLMKTTLEVLVLLHPRFITPELRKILPTMLNLRTLALVCTQWQDVPTDFFASLPPNIRTLAFRESPNSDDEHARQACLAVLREVPARYLHLEDLDIVLGDFKSPGWTRDMKERCLELGIHLHTIDRWP